MEDLIFWKIFFFFLYIVVLVALILPDCVVWVAFWLTNLNFAWPICWLQDIEGLCLSLRSWWIFFRIRAEFRSICRSKHSPLDWNYVTIFFFWGSDFTTFSFQHYSFSSKRVLWMLAHTYCTWPYRKRMPISLLKIRRIQKEILSKLA